MRNPLNKRLPRELKSGFWKYLSIFLVLTLSISFTSGFFVTAKTVHDNYYSHMKEEKVEDGLFASYMEIDPSIIEEVEKEDITVYQNYYFLEKWKDASLKIYNTEYRKDIDIPYYVKGNEPKNQDEIAVDHLFAEKNELKIGDNLGDYTISGLIGLPDFSSLVKNSTEILVNPRDFGVAVVSDNTFEEIPKDKLVYAYSYHIDSSVDYDGFSEKKKKEFNDTLIETLSESGVLLTEFTPKEDNKAISFIMDDMGKDRPSMMVFLVTSLIIISFIFSVLSRSTIEKESSEIGTLLSTGYTKATLIGHYILFPVFFTFFAAIAGNILGYLGISKAFLPMYQTIFSLPHYDLVFDSSALVLTTLPPIVIMFVITLFTLIHAMGRTPLQFLRKESKPINKSYRSKIPNLSFLGRFRIRVILQNKRNYLVMILGILFASTLLIFSLASKPTILSYVDKSEEMAPSKYQYTLKQPVELEEPNESAEKVLFYSMEKKADDKEDEVSFLIYGIQEDSQYIKDIQLSDNKDEITISQGAAKRYDIKIGDTLKLKDPHTNKNHEFEVYDIYESNGIYLNAYLSLDQLNELLDYDQGYFNGYLSKEELEIPEEFVASELTTSDVRKSISQTVDLISQMMVIMSVISIVFFLIVIFIITKTILEKNRHSIALMKILGYEDKKIKSVYITSTTIIFLLGVILCMFAEIPLVKWIMNLSLSQIEGYVEPYIPIQIFPIIFVIALVTYFVATTVLTSLIKKMNMGIVLKNID